MKADLIFFRWTTRGKIVKVVASGLTRDQAIKEAHVSCQRDHSDHFNSNKNCGYEWAGEEILVNSPFVK